MLNEEMLYGSVIGALIAAVATALGVWIISGIHGVIRRRSLAAAALVSFILGVITLAIAHLIVVDATNSWINRDVPEDGLYNWVHPGAKWTLLAYVSGVVVTFWRLRMKQRSRGERTSGAI